ncbi:choline/ethanolamine transporter flvcr2a-like [Ciona intestinalis]
MESSIVENKFDCLSTKEHNGVVTWLDDDTSCYVTDTSLSLLSDADDEMSHGLFSDVERMKEINNNNSFIETIDKCLDYEPLDGDEESWEELNDDVIMPTMTRWMVLFVTCFSIFIRSFVSVVFGQINDVFSNYYVITPGAADWLTNSATMATIVAVPVVAMVTKYRPNFRTMALLMTGSASVGTMMLTIAMIDRDIGFVVAIIGQTIMGVNNAIAMTIPPLVAAVWFPETEVTTAMASALMAVGAGDAVGSIVPPSIVATSDVIIAGGSGFDDSAILEKLRFRLVSMFAVTAGLSLITFMVAVAHVTEKPAMAPSEAQLRRRTIVTNTQQPPLYKNKEFILVAIIYGSSAASAANSVTLLSTMSRDAMGGIPGDDNYDLIAGRIMTSLFTFFAIGPIIAGRALDRNKKYQTMALIGLAGLVVGTTGTTCSLMRGSVVGLMTSHSILGMFMGVAETALLEIAAEVTYPHPVTTFSSILVMSWMTFFIFQPIVSRYALGNPPTWAKGSTIASLVPTSCAIVCFIVALVFLRPSYNRRRATTESTPLLRQ